MSLTSFLKNNKDVRDRLRQEVPKQKFTIKKEIQAPPRSRRFNLTGTAFDYLLRFHLQHLNPRAIGKTWVAERAVERLSEFPKLQKKGQKIVEQSKKTVAEFLKTGQINDEILKVSLLLGGLDPIFRAGVGHDQIGKVYKEDLEDLRKLIDLVKPELFKAKKICLINPTFGKASSLVGGADADIVIDDTLIDIKTTKKLQLLSTDFQQLIGYYTLHQIGSLGNLKPKLKIKKVAIYFSRFGYLHYFNIEELVSPRTFPDFVKWFEHRALKGNNDIADKAIKPKAMVGKSDKTLSNADKKKMFDPKYFARLERFLKEKAHQDPSIVKQFDMNQINKLANNRHPAQKKRKLK